MAVVDIIATLQPLTEQQKAAASLWERWVRADIEARARSLGVDVYALDPEQMERFVIEAILYRLAHPDDATQVEVQVDDARVNRRYSSSTGQLAYLPEWWDWLGLAEVTTSGAFSIAPTYTPDIGAAWGCDGDFGRRHR